MSLLVISPIDIFLSVLFLWCRSENRSPRHQPYCCVPIIIHPFLVTQVRVSLLAHRSRARLALQITNQHLHDAGSFASSAVFGAHDTRRWLCGALAEAPSASPASEFLEASQIGLECPILHAK
jgi:hypothetical protein